jgi:uncharacterized membrane protein (UPF0127 family)
VASSKSALFGRVVDDATGTVVADRLRLAHTHWTRLKGLLGTRVLEPGEGLWIKPCRQIHMFGMRYAIDVVFLDAGHRVVDVVEHIAPNRISRKVADAESALELPAGTVARTGLAPGAHLVLDLPKDAGRRAVFGAALVAGFAVACAMMASAAVADEPEAPPATTPPAAEATPTAMPEAPFGLTWLASKEEVIAVVGSLGKSFLSDFGDSYTVSRLPKELADQYYTVLSFGYDDRLIRVTAIGTGFGADDPGEQIRARYAEIKALLEEKYGAGKSEDQTDKDYTSHRWKLGLRRNRNWMYTEFTPPDMRVELSVFEDGPKTNWRLIFEHLPSIGKLKEQRKKIEEDAF